ncbi:MAG: hypothetical protein IJU31_06570 [Synergistaceae bacterium]|nr:hypothetical protein [Synergistaceae bacterium]
MRSRFFKFVFAVGVFAFCFASLNMAESAKLRRTGRDPEYDERDYRLNRAVLPNTGDIGVIVDGPDPQHNAIAEAIIIEELAANGYRVVDEARMKKLRAAAAKAQAARYALEGNVSAIMKLNGSYNAAAIVVARVRAGRPVVNEFKLYTGTASAAVIAVTSKGTKLGGKTAQSKTVGYTIEETEINAVEAAVRDGMAQMF